MSTGSIARGAPRLARATIHEADGRSSASPGRGGQFRHEPCPKRSVGDGAGHSRIIATRGLWEVYPVSAQTPSGSRSHTGGNRRLVSRSPRRIAARRRCLEMLRRPSSECPVELLGRSLRRPLVLQLLHVAVAIQAAHHGLRYPGVGGILRRLRRRAPDIPRFRPHPPPHPHPLPPPPHPPP